MGGFIVLKTWLLSLAFAHAMTGTATSGGGGAFVKRSADGNHAVESALLIDLWEAGHISFAWPKKPGTIDIQENTSSSAEELIGQWLTRLSTVDPALAAQVQDDYLYVRAHVNPLSAGTMLTLPDDLKLAYYPADYPPEGMMHFNGDSSGLKSVDPGTSGWLDINMDIFDHLASPLHVAAAWMHEALYKTMRESTFAHANSIMSRHLNACLFSADADCLAAKRIELPKDRWVFQCHTDTSDFWVYPISPVAPYDLKGYRVEFSRVAQVLPSEVFQEVHQIIFNRDGSKLGASGGPLQSVLLSYNYSPASAVVELSLNSSGELRGSTLRTLRSSLRGGFNLLPNGSETANCQQEMNK
jgi:hypothetical protein